MLAAALLLAACGSDSEGPAAGTNTTVTTVEGEAATAAAGTTATQQQAAAAESDAAATLPGEETIAAQEEGTVATAPETTETTTEVAAVGTTTTTSSAGIDPATGRPLAATAPSTGVAATGVTPAASTDPVLPGSEGAILQRPFAADSPWNTPIAGAPVDPRSERWMRQARIRIATVEQPGGGIEEERRPIDTGLTVNVTKWTVPVFSDGQEGSVPRVAVCRQLDCGPDAVSSVTIPPDACPDPRYDGWMTVIDNGNRDALDFWRARCEADGSISYHYVKRWDLDGPGFQPPTGVSARGSGLPLFAGLITPEEIRDGSIDHALAISVPGAAQRRYTQPASRTDGVGLVSSLPEGARLRLRPGAGDLLTRTFVRNGLQRATAGTLIAALEQYGAIVVDRSAAPTMYAQRNAQWTGILPLNLLQDIGLDQFEVIETGEIRFDPPLAGEATTLPGTPASIPGTAGGTQATEELGVAETGAPTP